MTDVSTVIFQRSQAGRDEIKQKTHGLTQSERLVLIMVDGITPRAAIRMKLPALTDERFDRALRRLQEKDLVLEVFMPIEGQDAETLEQGEVERFLRQDPLDPVTIIVNDPEDELGVPAPAEVRPAVAASSVSAIGPSATSSAPAAPPPATEPPIPELTEKERTLTVTAMDAVHNALADSLAEEVRLRQAQRLPRRESVDRNVLATAVVTEMQEQTGIGLHWGYWLIALGCTFIVAFVAMNLTR